MFKVGDVVEYSADAGKLILKYAQHQKLRVKLGRKGIVTEVHDGGFYSVSWFGNGTSVHETLELEVCGGFDDIELCEDCRYKNECWEIQNNL